MLNKITLKRWKYGLVIAVLAVSALLLAACGSNGAEQPDAAAPDTAEDTAADMQGVESDKDAGSTADAAVASGESSSEATSSQAGGQEDQAGDNEQSFAGKVAAPDFPAGLDWLNTDGPLTLSDLRGKVVLLDFWTYGCINCIHIIPDLHKLEEKWADELVVIGVHSAKFENEGDTDNIRNIILRYELEHPVVNDNQFQIWNEYGARAWPTLVLIDPEGKVLGYHSGEGIYEPFDEVIGGMVAEFDALGKIDRRPLDLKLEQDSQLNSPLLFPGKVLVDPNSNRLFIADSNHNRLVITDLDGIVLDVVGDGRARLVDGSYETASFFRPQGLALADDNTLFVADTENHAIRKVDLAGRQVETVAGTGEQVFNPRPDGPALSTPLNSPWDVLYHDGLLYIAMAGQHQVWVYDTESETIALFAGSGREELRDGGLTEGGLNQPSGLATDGDVLFIADSEASAIRTADLDPDGELKTIVGTGLFDFGDVDGQGDEVRLQHPLGVVYDDDQLYVTDTYNSKIKLISPDARESNTYLGGAESGWRDGVEPLFDEPGGLSLGEGKLYIADTNNHVIRVADLDTREVHTLVLVDMEGLLTRQPPDEEYSGKTVTLEPQSVSPGNGTVELQVAIPDGYKVNDLAPFSMEWTAGDGITVDPEQANQTIVEPEFPLSFAAEFTEGQSELTGDLVVYYCEAESESLCLIERVRVTAPLTVEAGGANIAVVDHTIELPES
ncbi:MAG TPA: thioredoxin-like domain-containing protein [Anaerolineae bacterium]|nr:thioredoxin-like domain-containing protein [Anaerolineae bacterium]